MEFDKDEQTLRFKAYTGFFGRLWGTIMTIKFEDIMGVEREVEESFFGRG